MTNLDLAYLVLQLPEPRQLTPVFGDVVGLMPGAPADTASTWRNDDRSQRIVVEVGPAIDAVAIGIEVSDSATFDATLRRLADLGYDADHGDMGDLAKRRVQKLARVAAPWGTDVEIVEGLERSDTPFSSALVPGGFLTDDVGFGHVVFATTAFEDATRFLVDGLGFGQSDWLEMELAPGLELEVRFFHCNARHHSIALAQAPFELPQSLHHIMFETNSRDDVGAAFDRAWDAGLPIPNGLGRHDNDGMFSFYLQTPAGFLVEVGHGARAIGPDWDDNRRYERMSAWGHQPLRQP